jgi:hypothetical protein
MLRYRKRLFWIFVAAIVTSALWVLNVEVTYERNVRHIPTDFRLQHRNPPNRWRT